MKKPRCLLGAAITIFIASTCSAQNLDEARRIQAGVLGFDTHNDTAQRVLIEKVDIGHRLPDGMIDLPRLQDGGVHVPFFALWVPTYYPAAEAVRRTLDLRDAMQGGLRQVSGPGRTGDQRTRHREDSWAEEDRCCFDN